MDAQQIAERQIVERYLADQLTEAEALGFEAYVEAHPEIVGDIEEISRMKSGLATLKKRGELDALRAQPKQPWYRRPSVLAASAAGLLIAVMFMQPWRGVADLQMAATLEAFPGHGGAPAALAGRVLLGRTRGLEPQTTVVPPDQSILEVTLDLHSADAGVDRSVSLMRVDAGALKTVAEVKGLREDTEGKLVLYVRAESLEAGDYLFRVSGSNATDVAEFALRVK